MMGSEFSPTTKNKKNNRTPIMTTQQQLFTALCRQELIAAPETEYRFEPSRKWRFDFAWPNYRIALEVEGGIFAGKKHDGGRHNRGEGFLKDIEKYNHATASGWRILRTTPQALFDSKTAMLIIWAMSTVQLERIQIASNRGALPGDCDEKDARHINVAEEGVNRL